MKRREAIEGDTPKSFTRATGFTRPFGNGLVAGWTIP
jgi:hypothetical protein